MYAAESHRAFLLPVILKLLADLVTRLTPGRLPGFDRRMHSMYGKLETRSRGLLVSDPNWPMYVRVFVAFVQRIKRTTTGNLNMRVLPGFSMTKKQPRKWASTHRSG